jgi:hypothetical protein
VPADPARPWSETSAAAWAFAYRARTDFVVKAATAEVKDVKVYDPADPKTQIGVIPGKAAVPGVDGTDQATSVGGGARLQYGSTELTFGALWEDHSSITKTLNPGDGQPAPAMQFAAYAELDYTVYIWLVPAIRVEQVTITPRGLPGATGTRLMPAVAMHLRPSMKLSINASLEKTSGLPAAGGDWSKLSGDGFNQPTSITTAVGWELTSVTATLGFGF